KRERRRFEAAFRNAPFGILVADDAGGERVRVNPAAAAMLGVPADEHAAPSPAAGLRLRQCLRRDDRPVPPGQTPLLRALRRRARRADRRVPPGETPLRRALRGGEVANEEFELAFPSGRRLAVLVGSSPILAEDGTTAGAVCAFADVTPLKQLQRELDLRRR